MRTGNDIHPEPRTVDVLEGLPDSLTYVDDSEPGYSRRRSGRGFVYLTPKGEIVRDVAAYDRFRALAVPPAWTDVWLCHDPRGHIQATGRDAKGRKQYRYHPDWEAARSATKFDSLYEFGEALPNLRRRVLEDMSARELSLERVVATTVWLLDNTLIRVGNREYAETSYGLTTLKNRHVQVGAETLRFRFAGKSGKPHDVSLRHRHVARIIKRCQELPGQNLLEYVTEGGVRSVDSRDVNAYIRDVTTADFTAKTFRTWGASAHATGFLRTLGQPSGKADAATEVRDIVKATARLLGNTPAVCRNSYIHPAVIEAHIDGRLHRLAPSRRAPGVLDLGERTLMSVLKAHRQAASRHTRSTGADR